SGSCSHRDPRVADSSLEPCDLFAEPGNELHTRPETENRGRARHVADRARASLGGTVLDHLAPRPTEANDELSDFARRAPGACADVECASGALGHRADECIGHVVDVDRVERFGAASVHHGRTPRQSGADEVRYRPRPGFAGAVDRRTATELGRMTGKPRPGPDAG